MELKDPELLERMLKAGRLKNWSELARALGLTPQAISNYRKKGDIPPGLIFKFAEIYNVSIDWLLTGRGEMLYAAMKSPGRVCSIAVVEKTFDGANGRFCVGMEHAALNPEEIIYVGKLLTILRQPEGAAVPAIKTNIDAFFKTFNM